MSEDFLAALEGKTLLKELLKNEDWEKQFRSSLKMKEENVIKYLVQPEVLSDMVQALINEEGIIYSSDASSYFLDRTLQEASEVLGIILSNVGAINVCTFFEEKFTVHFLCDLSQLEVAIYLIVHY